MATASTIMTVAMIVRPERLPGAGGASAECSGPVVFCAAGARSSVFCAAGARSSRTAGCAPLFPPCAPLVRAWGPPGDSGRRKAGAPRWGPPRWGRALPEADGAKPDGGVAGGRPAGRGAGENSAGGPGTREKPEVPDGGACEKPPGAAGETGADGAACPA
jgi:hypothetical protein